MKNPVVTHNGSLWYNVLIRTLLLVLIGYYIFYLGHNGVKEAILFTIAPIAIVCAIFLFRSPRAILITLFVYNYFAMGVTRYIPGMLGLGVDGLLVFCYLALFFKSFKEEVGFKRAANGMTLMAILWYVYAVLELFNPEADSKEAWVYAMRGFSLYFFLTVPLTFVVFHRYKDLNLILRLWAYFSIFAVFKGWCQLYIGMDWGEQKWMDEGGALTHMIWSGLRVFSIFTDAGQFGASIAHSGVVFTIVALGRKNIREKLFYLFVAMLSFYGMGLSGTRGAMAVPVAGFFLYLLLIKNWKLFSIGLVFLLGAFVFFKYTTLGSGNAQIVRMRSSFDPNDPSLQVRLANQARLKVYLNNKPFGCGIGASGSWGQRFTPYKLPGQIPTDSWYVAVWVDQGIVGLCLHLFILFYGIIVGGWVTMTKVKDKQLFFNNVGLLSGFMGIVAASYGNSILGQMPTGLMMYMSIAFIFMGPLYQKEIDEKLINKELS